MEELGSECTSHPLSLTIYRLPGVPNTGGSAIVYTAARDDDDEEDLSSLLNKMCVRRVWLSKCNSGL
eukprot:SAG11_NODE_13869_length_635_cov_1.194030_1_plen_66_part_10